MKKTMKRWLALSAALLVALSIAGCKDKKNPDVEEQPDSGTDTTASPEPMPDGEGLGINGVEYWLGKVPSVEGPDMDETRIAEYNVSLMADAASKCVDLGAYPETLPSAELTAMLDETPIPTDERYVGEVKASDTYYQAITTNMDKAGVETDNPVQFGYITSNVIMRSFPTADPSYEFPNDAEFDLSAETMLKIWEPVAVLHSSADRGWYFVQSYNYRGWIPVSSAALAADRTEWMQYLNPSQPLVITGNRVTLNENVYNPAASGLELFMGTALPMVSGAPELIDGMDTSSGHTVLLPERTGGGKLAVRQALVPWNADARVGYLPYTKANLLRQAFKMLGDRHGWSGMNKSRDSTALVMDVYQTFGLKLPRNSAQQAAVPGTSTDLSGLGEAEKAAKLLEQPAGSLLTMDGHVAIYLGDKDGIPYVLHSIYVAFDPAKNEKIYNAVIVTDLSLCDKDGNTFLSKINAAKIIG